MFRERKYWHTAKDKDNAKKIVCYQDKTNHSLDMSQDFHQYNEMLKQEMRHHPSGAWTRSNPQLNEVNNYKRHPDWIRVEIGIQVC